jgi:hypothetical protein
MAKASKSVIIADEVVMNKIYYIRKQKVMLDRERSGSYGIAECDTIQKTNGWLSSICFY